MSKRICNSCELVFDDSEHKNPDCPKCGRSQTSLFSFSNSDAYIRQRAPEIYRERQEAGLEGLVKGLQAVVINTEPAKMKDSAQELMRYTGLDFDRAFADERRSWCVLKREGCADFLISSRQNGDNLFKCFNIGPKANNLPDTRLETFIFEVSDLEKYFSIQQERGCRFITDHVIHTPHYSMVQTGPSKFTGNSLGFIQWHKNRGDYSTSDCRGMDWHLKKPDRPHLKNIRELDHCATRIRARSRDAAIVEFLEYTNYRFDFAIYVKGMNSITSVARLSDGEYAMVFTSGIFPYVSDGESGPTEKFIKNYNTRVHHMAFNTDDIEKTVAELTCDGMEYLIELVGSPEEGLKQTFTRPSPNTLIVNEYIHRYGDYDGFFTRSNVSALTEATGRQ